ncbi:hypothetical protein AB3K78_15570 [Leucobacter sp. HNU]|uniref:hypothetical protein n=1 Tax=Leucobacter sp. HNU TaxID=3236805 RepID=UPI003A80CA76
MPRQFYISDEERLAKILKQQARSLSDVQRPTGTEREQTLARLQSAVAELDARVASTISAPDFSVTATDPGGAPGNANWQSGQRQFVLPTPSGGARFADISVSGDLAGSSSAGTQPTAYLAILNGNSVVATEMVGVPKAGSAGYPPIWNPRFRLSADVLVAATPFPLTIRLYVGAYSSGGNVTITVTSLSATVRYGQRL